MIIDLILDRQDGEKYEAKDFYNNVTKYGKVGFEIAEALDSGEDGDVKKALSKYVIDGDYNIGIILYIMSVEWI